MTSGYYQYGFSPVEESTASASMSFAGGRLRDGNLTSLNRWLGNGTGPTVLATVFDLQREMEVKRLVIHSSFPNQYWAIQSISVEIRSATDGLYRTVATIPQPGNAWTQLEIPIPTAFGGVKARYVRLKLQRAHNYIYVGLAEVQIYAAPSSEPLLPTTNLTTELSKSADVLATAGYYAYGTNPVEESSTAGSLAFGAGKLTDSITNSQATWPGSSSGPTSLPIVFDLQRDVPVQRVVVNASFPNQYWKINSIIVETRASGDAVYTNHAAVYPTGATWNRCEISARGQTARYVRVTLLRPTYTYLGTSEIQIYTSPSSATLQTSASLATEFGKDTLLLDAYGQYLHQAWAGKITSPADLVAQRDAENLVLPTTRPAGSDQYGGWIGSGPHAPVTGYFQVRKIAGKWWFLTPEGNKFFLNAICGTKPASWNSFTSVTKPDNVTQRGCFQELPVRATYPQSWDTSTGTPRVSFVMANLYKKYGGTAPSTPWAGIMKRRMWDWGFNAHGKWEMLPTATLRIPFIGNLYPATGTVKIGKATDPFDPNFAANVQAGVQSYLTGNATNPWLIGVIFESESGWDLTVINGVMKLPASRAAKVNLVNFLFSRYTAAQLGTAFGLTVNSPADLLNATPNYPSSLNADALDFIAEVAGPLYWSTVEAKIRMFDTNHLFMGGALYPGWKSCIEWELSALPYIDVLSLDYYKNNAAWFTSRGYAAEDIPVVLLEYGLVTTERGMGYVNDVTCANQAERGKYYRSLLENLASYPNFVGASFYTLWDEAPTGNASGGGGSNCNWGLLSQQDQPYADMITEVRKSAFPRLYEVHEGLVAPYTYAP